MTRYWVIAPYDSQRPELFDAAWKFDTTNGTIAIGWKELGDPSKLSRQELDDVYSRAFPGKPASVHTKDCNVVWRFHHEISAGDIVIARRGTRRIVGIGTVTGPAYYDEQKGFERVGKLSQDFYSNLIPVDWEPTNIDLGHIVFSFFTMTEISAEKFASLTQPTGAPPEPPEIAQEAVAEFALEKHLENFIVENFDHIFNGHLRLYRDADGTPGQQYPTVDDDGKEIGYIDILATDATTGDFVVIELKKGRESDKVVGQILRYIGWVKENLCTPEQGVRGVVICNQADQRLQWAVKPVGELIQVKLYRIDFQLLDPSTPTRSSERP
jgi:restriction system protein